VEEDEIGRAYSKNSKKRNAYQILVGKPEGKTLANAVVNLQFPEYCGKFFSNRTTGRLSKNT
jgi:hypothetical protein